VIFGDSKMLDKIKTELAKWDLHLEDEQLRGFIDHFGLTEEKDIPDFVKTLLGAAGINYESTPSVPVQNSPEDLKVALMERIKAKVEKEATDIVKGYTAIPEQVQERVIADLVQIRANRLERHIPTGLDEFRQIASYSQLFHENVHLSQINLNRILLALLTGFILISFCTLAGTKPNDKDSSKQSQITSFEEDNRGSGRIYKC
jgi:hypothetical protein